MAVPFLKTMGGLMLIGVAIKIIVDESGHTDVVAKENLWGAVASIVTADALMSLDNVIAIAAASEGSMALTIFGLALSVPIVVFGAGLVMLTLERFPFLVGAALLGWVAVDLIAEDPLWAKQAWFTFDMLGSALSRAA